MKLKNSRLVHYLLSNWHQKVIALVASLFIYVFYRIGTQSELTIPLEVKRPPGYELSQEWPKRVTLVFRGTRGNEKYSDADFKATADLTGFVEGGTVRAAVKVEIVSDAVKRNPPDFDYSPSVIEFVLERVTEKYVPIDVKAGVRGTLPPGYMLESLKWSPQNVLVRGPKSRVDAVTKAAIQPIDLAGRRSPFSIPTKIVLPNAFVRAVTADDVVVTAVIKGEKTLESVGWTLVGLRADLTALAPPRGTIALQGSTKLMENAAAAGLTLAVDCREITGPGVYTLAVPRPELPPDLAAEGAVTGWEPKEVKLQIVPKGKDGQH